MGWAGLCIITVKLLVAEPPLIQKETALYMERSTAVPPELSEADRLILGLDATLVPSIPAE